MKRKKVNFRFLFNSFCKFSKLIAAQTPPIKKNDKKVLIKIAQQVVLVKLKVREEN